MKILFTGHRGFLGREIIPLIRPFGEISTFEGDLRNKYLVEEFIEKNGVDRIIHAAVKGARRDEIQSEQTLCDNLQMSCNLAYTDLPMLTICSGKIFGYQVAIEGAKETECLNRFPTDFYGQSKFIFYSIARDMSNVHFMRFFNVFGVSEQESRFVRANIQRSLRGQPMIIHRDILMDTFYVKDSIPFIQDWIIGSDIPHNINMVYEKKLKLSEICMMINELVPKPVEIKILESGTGINYFGDGELLQAAKYPLMGLKQGLADIVSYYKLVT